MTATRFLSNREAARLLMDWGFVAVKTKGKHAGGHAFYAYQDESGPRVAITAPGRKADTPPMTYKKAAAIVGVPLADFLAGPSKHTNTNEPGIPVVEEQIMRGSSGAVQTPVTEFADRVKYVLQEAEEPMAYGHLAGAAGLQGHRGETVSRAIEHLQAHDVKVREEYRRGKSGRAFKVVFLEGSKADPTQREKVDPLVTLAVGGASIDLTHPLTLTPKKEAEIVAEVPRRPLTQQEKIAKATAASSARMNAIMDSRVESIMDLIEKTGDPVTREEVSNSLGLTINQAVQALNHGIKAGVLFTRKASSRDYQGGKIGTRPKGLYHHDDPIPFRKNKIARTVPQTTAEIIEEITMDAETIPTPTLAPIAHLDPDIPAIQILRTRPDGSLLLVDAAGDLYVAKKIEV